MRERRSTVRLLSTNCIYICAHCFSHSKRKAGDDTNSTRKKPRNAVTVATRLDKRDDQEVTYQETMLKIHEEQLAMEWARLDQERRQEEARQADNKIIMAGISSALQLGTSYLTMKLEEMKNNKN